MINPKLKQIAWKVLSQDDFSDFQKEVGSLGKSELNEKDLCFLYKLSNFFYKKLMVQQGASSAV